VTVGRGSFYSGTAGWGTSGGECHAVAESEGGRGPDPTGRRRAAGNGLAVVHAGRRRAGALSAPNSGGQGSLTHGPLQSQVAVV
jgi:hypothetical protein